MFDCCCSYKDGNMARTVVTTLEDADGAASDDSLWRVEPDEDGRDGGGSSRTESKASSANCEADGAREHVNQEVPKLKKKGTAFSLGGLINYEFHDDSADAMSPAPSSTTGGGHSFEEARNVPQQWSPQPDSLGAMSSVTQEIKAIRAGLSRCTCCVKLIEHPLFTLGLALVTVYVLFVPDLDVIYGDKDSKVVLSILTTIVFFFTFMELILHSLFKQKYAFRAFFWLDLIALISLLPDTYMVQQLLSDEELVVAGRQSRLLRIVKAAARATRVTRLNRRLARIIWVAALIPKLVDIWTQRGNARQAEKLLNRKLHRVFKCLDDDMDDYITLEAMDVALDYIHDELCPEEPRKQSMFTEGEQSHSATSRAAPQGQGRAETPLVLVQSKHPMQHARSGSGLHAAIRKPLAHSPTLNTAITAITLGSSDEDDETLKDFDFFRCCVLEDEDVRKRMVLACRAQVSRSDNMQNIAAWHSEDVGVKVALGVLFMLFLLTILEAQVVDTSATVGLQHLDAFARRRGWGQPGQENITSMVRNDVDMWRNGVRVAIGQPRLSLLFLDINRQIYCNELVSAGNAFYQSCDPEPGVDLWRARFSLGPDPIERINELWRESEYRLIDLAVSQVDNLDEVTSIGVFENSDFMAMQATMSIACTAFSIFMIVAGIALITWDIGYLSRSLRTPLRSLADEMQSVVYMQLKGLSVKTEKGTAEVRLIQQSFEQMKMAIKSWGKYVPWPVVQTLLNEGVSASSKVQEAEVTIFFSDIASFTSIVEGLPPEDVMLLLTRYFNDMSKVIDHYNGIVIEFIGDAILAVFGQPQMTPNHPTSAVKATTQMFAALAKINSWAVENSLPEVKIRCGVHTGTVLVGNMGFKSRLKYGVMGENASIPADLEEMNKTYSTTNLISGNTVSRLTAETFVVRPIDYVCLRHGASSEVVYEVLGRQSSSEEVQIKMLAAAELHGKALKSYRQRQFNKAATRFTEVGNKMREITGETDKVSSMFVHRCHFYAETPPGADWNCVWNGPDEPAKSVPKPFQVRGRIVSAVDGNRI